MITRTYVVVCPSCHGTGQLVTFGETPNTQPCPACNGGKTVMMTETIYRPLPNVPSSPSIPCCEDIPIPDIPIPDDGIE